MSKHWKLKEAGLIYKLAFVSTNNPVKKSFRKIKKSSNVGQEWKTLIPVFTYF